MLLSVAIVLTNNYSYASTLFKTKSHAQRFLEEERPNEEKAFECLRLTVPAKFGNVIQHHKGKKQGLIVHIQDRHADETAQLNIASIIDVMEENYDIDLLCLEGASDKLDTSFYDNIPDTKAKEITSRFYVHEGLFTGAEYYKILNKDKEISAFGVEDKNLYFKHAAAYKKHNANTKEIGSYLKALERGLNTLKTHIFSRPLKAIDNKKQAYKIKQIELGEFVAYITKEAVKKDIQLSAYPNLKVFSQAMSAEKEIDFEKAESQRDRLVKRLSNILKDDALSTLLKNSLDFKLNKISASAYYEYVEDIADFNKDSINKTSYKQLFAYIDYIKLSDKVDNIILFDEIEAALKDIKTLCYANNTEKLFDDYIRYIELSIDLYDLKLTEKNMNELSALKKTVNMAQVVSFINKQNNIYNISSNLVTPPANNEAFKDALDYYELALKRDIALISNTLRRMAVSGKDSSVLVAGGFHTQGIVNILKQLDISYIVVCPKIGSGDYEKIYQRQMNNQMPSPDAILNFMNSMLADVLHTGKEMVDVGYAQKAKEQFLLHMNFVKNVLLERGKLDIESSSVVKQTNDEGLDKKENYAGKAPTIQDVAKVSSSVEVTESSRTSSSGTTKSTEMTRRDFLKTIGVLTAGAVLGNARLSNAEDNRIIKNKQKTTAEIEDYIDKHLPDDLKEIMLKHKETIESKRKDQKEELDKLNIQLSEVKRRCPVYRDDSGKFYLIPIEGLYENTGARQYPDRRLMRVYNARNVICIDEGIQNNTEAIKKIITQFKHDTSFLRAMGKTIVEVLPYVGGVFSSILVCGVAMRFISKIITKKRFTFLAYTLQDAGLSDDQVSIIIGRLPKGYAVAESFIRLTELLQSTSLSIDYIDSIISSLCEDITPKVSADNFIKTGASSAFVSLVHSLEAAGSHAGDIDAIIAYLSCSTNPKEAALSFANLTDSLKAAGIFGDNTGIIIRSLLSSPNPREAADNFISTNAFSAFKGLIDSLEASEISDYVTRLTIISLSQSPNPKESVESLLSNNGVFFITEAFKSPDKAGLLANWITESSSNSIELLVGLASHLPNDWRKYVEAPELAEILLLDEFVEEEYRRNPKDMTEELFKPYLEDPQFTKIRYLIKQKSFYVLKEYMKANNVSRDKIIEACCLNSLNDIISQATDLIVDYEGRKGILKGFRKLESKIDIIPFTKESIEFILSQLGLTTDSTEESLNGMGYKILNHEKGQLIVPMGFEFLLSAYRGSTEYDHKEANYLTHAITTAIVHYANKGGEAYGDDETRPYGANAFHEFDLGLMMIEGRNNREVDKNVSLAFHYKGDPLPEYARKRTLTLKGIAVADLIQRLLSWQIKEKAAKQNIYKIFTWIIEAKLSKEELKLAIKKIKEETDILKDKCGLKDSYYQAVFGFLDNDFFKALEANYNPSKNNKDMLISCLKQAIQGREVVKAGPRNGNKPETVKHPWLNKKITLLNYLNNEEKIRRWTFEEEDLSSVSLGMFKKDKEGGVGEKDDFVSQVHTALELGMEDFAKMLISSNPKLGMEDFAKMFISSDFRVINTGSTGRGTNLPGSMLDFDYAILFEDLDLLADFLARIKDLPKALNRNLKSDYLTEFYKSGRMNLSGTLITYKLFSKTTGNSYDFQLTAGGDKDIYADYFWKQMKQIESLGGNSKKIIRDIVIMKSLLRDTLHSYKKYHGGLSGIGIEQMIVQSNGAEEYGGTIKGIGSFNAAMELVYRIGFDHNAQNARSLEEVIKKNQIYDPELKENMLSHLNPMSWRRLVNAAKKYIENPKLRQAINESTEMHNQLSIESAKELKKLLKPLAYELSDALNYHKNSNYALKINYPIRFNNFSRWFNNIFENLKEKGLVDSYDFEIVDKDIFYLFFKANQPDQAGEIRKTIEDAIKKENVIKEAISPALYKDSTLMMGKGQQDGQITKETESLKASSSGKAQEKIDISKSKIVQDAPKASSSGSINIIEKRIQALNKAYEKIGAPPIISDSDFIHTFIHSRKYHDKDWFGFTIFSEWGAAEEVELLKEKHSLPANTDIIIIINSESILRAGEGLGVEHLLAIVDVTIHHEKIHADLAKNVLTNKMVDIFLQDKLYLGYISVIMRPLMKADEHENATELLHEFLAHAITYEKFGDYKFAFSKQERAIGDKLVWLLRSDPRGSNLRDLLPRYETITYEKDSPVIIVQSSVIAESDFLQSEKVEKSLRDFIDTVTQKYQHGEYEIKLEQDPDFYDKISCSRRLYEFYDRIGPLLDSIPVSIPGHMRGYDFDDILFCLMCYSYDAITSYYDPEVMPKKDLPKNYAGNIAISFNVETINGEKNLVVRIADNGLEKDAVDPNRKQEVNDINENFYSGIYTQNLFLTKHAMPFTNDAIAITKDAIAPYGRFEEKPIDKEDLLARNKKTEATLSIPLYYLEEKREKTSLLKDLQRVANKSIENLHIVATDAEYNQAINEQTQKHQDAANASSSDDIIERTSSGGTKKPDSSQLKKAEDAVDLNAIAAKVFDPLGIQEYMYVKMLGILMNNMRSGRPSAYIIERGNIFGKTAQVMPKGLLEFFIGLPNEIKTYLILDISKNELTALLKAYNLEPCEHIKSCEEILDEKYIAPITKEDRAEHIKALIEKTRFSKLGLGSRDVNIGIVANPVTTQTESEFNTVYHSEDILKTYGARVAKVDLDKSKSLSLPRALHALVSAFNVKDDRYIIDIILPPMALPQEVLDAIEQYRKTLKLILQAA